MQEGQNKQKEGQVIRMDCFELRGAGAMQSCV